MTPADTTLPVIETPLRNGEAGRLCVQRLVGRHSTVTLYLGDCLAVLPEIAWDVLITDPPYGIAHASGWDGPWQNSEIHGDESTDHRSRVLALNGERPAAVFGTWRVERPKGTRAVLVWNKGPASGMGDLSFPWKPSWEEIYVLGKGWSGRRDEGVLNGSVVTWASKGRKHPNEKPVSLVAQLVTKAPPGIICDPFMGSGTTGLACLRLKRDFIGIEKDATHFATALERMRSEVEETLL